MKAIFIVQLLVILSGIHSVFSVPCACAKSLLEVIAGGDDDDDYQKLVTLHEGQCLLQDPEEQNAYSRTSMWLIVKYGETQGYVPRNKVFLKECHSDPEEELSGSEDIYCRTWKFKHETMVTAYFPSDDGQYVDMRGLSIRTLQDYLAGEVTFVTIAMDTGNGVDYGTQVCIPQLNNLYGRMIEFRVMDTASWLQGYSYSRIGLSVRTKEDSESQKLNGPMTIVFK